jgi:FkbH-like protein
VIKCVVWDLDNTLLSGIYLESAGLPPAADPVLSGVLTDLAGRGILHAIASRNPPEAASHAEQVTGQKFAAVRCDWGAKSAAIASIMAELDLAADAVSFVDDDALERAEVSFTLPDVLVLAPQEMPAAVRWPAFSPPVLTGEGRRRGEMYRQRRARQEEAQAFGGSREEFLRYCRTRVVIGQAGQADVPRLHELSVRTHQFNSAASELSAGDLAGLLGSAGHRVTTVRLSDRFGDDGLVGCCVIDTTLAAWQVPLLMMSCRALGRGVIDALLAWLCLAASQAGADRVDVACVLSPRNVPLRIALTAAGFRAAGAGQAGGPFPAATFARAVDGALPVLPGWVAGPPDDRVTGALRRLLAEITGDDRPLLAGPGTPLLRDGIGLDSLGGTMLLARVRDRLGVDIAAEDLNLDALATLGTLAEFVGVRVTGQ